MAGIDDLPTGAHKVQTVTSMFDAIAPRYDLVNRVMTFGMDVGWRKKTVRSLGLPVGSLVLDVACGTGDLCRELRKARLRAVGIDRSAGMLARARTTAPLVLADALLLPFRDGEADGITCGFALRNVVDLEQLLSEFARVTRPGGRIALLEVSEPKSALLKTGHRLYFHRVVPLIGGAISDRKAYTYLPRSSAYLPPPPDLLEMIRAAGFGLLRREVLGLGAAQLVSASRM